MKKYKWLIILIAVIIALITISYVFSTNEDKYIKETTVSKIVSKKDKKESFILYIKQTNCEHCKIFSPRFASALKETGLKAYSLNLSQISEDEQELYDKTFKIDGTPTVLFIINGNESMIKIEGEQSKDRIIEKIEAAGFVNKK